MKAIICGAGRVGTTIAQKLIAEGEEVTIIDKSHNLINALTSTKDVKGVVGNASFPHILKKAGAQEADLIIAVTRSDEVNMITCQVAHSLFKIPLKIARIRAQDYKNDTYADLFAEHNMPVDVIISPELNCAKQISERMTFPLAVDTKSMANGKIWMVAIEIIEECPIINTPIYQITTLFPQLKVTIIAIDRNQTTFCPNKTDTIEIGDKVYLIAGKEDIHYAYRLISTKEEKIKKLIIIGGGNIGYFTAKELAKQNINTTIIESNKQRATDIEEALDNVLVLNGDGLNMDILIEAGIAKSQALLALTNNQNVNLLVSVLSKKLGCKNTLSIINDPLYGMLSEEIGLDRYIDPKTVTISNILQHIRRGRIKELVSLQNNRGELIDAIALETSPLVGSKLRDCDILKGIKIGTLLRNDEVIYPDGDTIVKKGDRVFAFSLPGNIKYLEKMFKVSVDFF